MHTIHKKPTLARVVFGILRNTSEYFGILRKSSEVSGSIKHINPISFSLNNQNQPQVLYLTLRTSPQAVIAEAA